MTVIHTHGEFGWLLCRQLLTDCGIDSLYLLHRNVEMRVRDGRE